MWKQRWQSSATNADSPTQEVTQKHENGDHRPAAAEPASSLCKPEVTAARGSGQQPTAGAA